jgi:hypothetical protein
MFRKDQLWTTNGLPKTNSLFKETCKPENVPIMSLNGLDTSLPCLRELYVALTVDDPTESVFADAVFSDLRYWLKLREAAFMPSYLADWRSEADIKRKQKAFSVIIAAATNVDDKNSFAAAKYLIDEPWKGRTKAVQTVKKDTTAKAYDHFSEDVARLKEEGMMQ